jgi:hypothetical protein
MFNRTLSPKRELLEISAFVNQGQWPEEWRSLLGVEPTFPIERARDKHFDQNVLFDF